MAITGVCVCVCLSYVAKFVNQPSQENEAQVGSALQRIISIFQKLDLQWYWNDHLNLCYFAEWIHLERKVETTIQVGMPLLNVVKWDENMKWVQDHGNTTAEWKFQHSNPFRKSDRSNGAVWKSQEINWLLVPLKFSRLGWSGWSFWITSFKLQIQKSTAGFKEFWTQKLFDGWETLFVAPNGSPIR